MYTGRIENLYCKIKEGRNTPALKGVFFRRGFVFLTVMLVAIVSSTNPGNTQALVEQSSAKPEKPIITINFGVQSTEGTTRALERWRPLIKILNTAAKRRNTPYRFTIHPYTIDEIRKRIAGGNIDIFFSDPATFLWAEVKTGARPLLSGALVLDGKTIKQNSTVIFSRSGKTNIRTIKELRGRRVMAVDPNSFYGWLLAKEELNAQNIDPVKYFSSLLFSNGNQRDVIYAVKSGLVDAGIIKSGVIERLSKDGVIKLSDFSVVSGRKIPGFPFASSTGIFPGWVLSARRGLPDQVLASVIETLLKTSPDSMGARNADTIVWLAPQNYESARKTLIYLRAAPYENYFLAAASRIFHLYRMVIISGILVIILSLLFLFYQLKRNVRLLEENRDVLSSEKRSRQFYRTAIEEHAVFCMLDKDGVISHVNSQFCEVTDYSCKDLLKLSLTELVPASQQQVLEAEIAKIRTNGKPWSGSLQFIKPDGSEVWTQCTIIPVTKTGSDLSEIAVVASDVTRTCVSLSNKRFHDSLELISDDVIVLAPDNLEVLYCNKVAAKHLCSKIDEDGWEGRNLAEFMTPSDFETFQMHAEALIKGLEPRMTWEVENDTDVPYEISLEYVCPTNDEPRLVALYRDLSERRIAEIAKSEFVATISHELRTPLTSMKGALGLITSGAMGELPAKVDKLVKMANDNCNRLGLLINDILDMEKIDAGKMDYDMKIIDLADVVHASVKSNQCFADKFGVSIKAEIDDDPDGHFISGDPQRLAQILDNLLSNAAKFSFKGGKITARVQLHHGNVQLAVKDSGSGIPKHAKAKIFDRFTQADSSDIRSAGGTGLGLAIVKLIVEAHHGAVWFDSVEGKGTEFFINFPRVIDGKTVSSADAPVPEKSGGISQEQPVPMIEQDYLRQAEALVKHLRDDQAKTSLHLDKITSAQIASGNGMVGQTNILTWISPEARTVVSDCLASEIIDNVDAFVISSEVSLEGDDSQNEKQPLPSDTALGEWFEQLADSVPDLQVSVLTIGDSVHFAAARVNITHAVNLDTGLELAQLVNIDFVVYTDQERTRTRQIIIPTKNGRMQGTVPLLVLEIQTIKSDAEQGEVGKFARMGGRGRGKDRRKNAS